MERVASALQCEHCLVLVVLHMCWHIVSVVGHPYQSAELSQAFVCCGMSAWKRQNHLIIIWQAGHLWL